MEDDGSFNKNGSSVQDNLAIALSLLLPSTDVGFLVASFFREVPAGIRRVVVVPALKLMVLLCLIMSVMLITEKIFMGAVSLYVKVFRRKPDRIYKWEPIVEDPELGSSAYPMILVQIPMYNEKEVYKLSIEAACNLSWPTDRIIIQVLDDSTDPQTKDLVLMECKKWGDKGRNVKYETRGNRSGYKAGALKEGMKHCYTHKCEHVVIFDADFQPESDFLLHMVPFLEHNPQVALVQARWKFVNADECLMTRLQEMSMDYHFKVEQESGSSIHSFFGFNGTAGIWRIAALNEVGGWNDRTTVEDMDLAIRASLGGWKFVYVGDIKVKSELPSTFRAYRYQQHRWTCGPANLFRKMAWEIITNKRVSVWKKFYLMYNFFLTRRIVAHFVTFFFYCVVIPTSVFFAEVTIPTWAVIYIPTAVTVLNTITTPSSFHLIVFWVLFENVMSIHRTKAAIIGLVEGGRVNEWVVTEKLGDPNKTKMDLQAVDVNPSNSFFKSKHLMEVAVGLYLAVCGVYDLTCGNDDKLYIYVISQSMAFLIMGFGYVGTFVPN